MSEKVLENTGKHFAIVGKWIVELRWGKVEENTGFHAREL